MPRTMEDFLNGKETVKEKIWSFGQKGLTKVKETVEWVKENPQAAAILAGGVTAVAGVAKKGIRAIDKHASLRQEKSNKERYVYDHSLNMYLKTKRPLNRKDVERINAQRKTGKKLSEILEELDLLK